MKALVGAFNHEKAIGAFSVIVKTDCETDGSFTALLIGRDLVAEKRRAENEPNYQPLTPTAKVKSRYNQFTLKRKKSKSDFDTEDCLVCPLSPMMTIQK